MGMNVKTYLKAWTSTTKEGGLNGILSNNKNNNNNIKSNAIVRMEEAQWEVTHYTVANRGHSSYQNNA